MKPILIFPDERVPPFLIRRASWDMHLASCADSSSITREAAVLAAWADNPTLYQGVVRQYCRTCHVAQPQSFTKFSDFQGFANIIEHEVCDTHDMPHAQVPFGVDGTNIGFWHDLVAQHDLGNFLHEQGIDTCLPHD